MSDLIPKHGGYRDLKSFHLARLIFDITTRFCNKFVMKGSRTNDQMVQAARSGVQNIAEGSQASGTSKKTELKLTNVARSSLEELKLDYEDFLRQRNMTLWENFDNRIKDLINKKYDTATEFALWAQDIAKKYQIDLSEAAANGTLALIRVACSLLNRQLQAQAKAFQNEGGFTERLYHFRKKQNGQNGQNGQ